ncbi:LPS export ABC transporter permease LptF [Rubrivivax sp. A210]|uniref:LPS export ABC transporter permease LptF n=1 Tax=Rubrivivax sp. A210 TaxID=2772301 RepID=UPI001918AC30|nr:LPS export ABC transporter permease LptF [Rubrivivax sp. A210]CAD5373747.1 LPS export ABC transporter permease LptF [Rubrivivax sp. A210]
MLFDSTVRRELARGFGATLVVILTIMLTMLLIRTIGQAASGAVAAQDVVLLLGYVALGQLPTMLSLSMFVAIVIGLGRMYRDSEMVIWFASGVSLARFVRPVLRTCWPVLIVVAVLALFAWPWGNGSSQDLRDRYQQRSDLARVTPGVFQASANGHRVFFVERESADGINARNVFILAREELTESVTSARAGRLETEGDQRFLVLERGQRNEVEFKGGERTLASFEGYRVLAGERASGADAKRPPKTVPTLELIGDPTARHQGELTWRLGLVLAPANLLLLGIALSAANPRRASNWNLLFALLAFIVYYNIVNLSQAWVGSGRLGMGLALSGVHGAAFALALALLWWRDHAAVLRWRLGSSRA